MKVGRHGLREHLRLLIPMFILITGVWILRMIFAIAGSPAWLVRITSVTTATSAALLLAVLALHARKFGGYASVVLSAFLINLWSEFLIIAAIAFSVITRIPNIYSAPEYSIPGNDPSHLRHIYAHLTFGVGTGTLVGAAFGSLLLMILRSLLPVEPPIAAPGEEIPRRSTTPDR
jgi:hypothetical protein